MLGPGEVLYKVSLAVLFVLIVKTFPICLNPLTQLQAKPFQH